MVIALSSLRNEAVNTAGEDEVPGSDKRNQIGDLKWQVIPDLFWWDVAHVEAEGDVHEISKWEDVDGCLCPVGEKEQGDDDAAEEPGQTTQEYAQALARYGPQEGNGQEIGDGCADEDGKEHRYEPGTCSRDIGRHLQVKEKTGCDEHGEGAEDAGRSALCYGAAVPEEIQVGRAHELIDDIARTHHGAYVGVGTLVGNENEKCLAEPYIGDDFIGGHGLWRGG